MDEAELKVLRKAAAKAKRIATEKASELHDLVEDRLPAGYQDLMTIAQDTYDACKAWEVAQQEFDAAEAKVAETV